MNCFTVSTASPCREVTKATCFIGILASCRPLCHYLPRYTMLAPISSQLNDQKATVNGEFLKNNSILLIDRWLWNRKL
jgi:hypothetical protein